MKQINTALVFGVLALSSTTPALALSITTGPNRVEVRNEIRQETKDMVKDVKEIRVETRNEIRTGGQELKATNAQNRNQFRQQRLTATYQGIKDSLARRLEYLNTIKARIQTRLTEMETAGKNVADAKAKLATYSDSAYQTDLAAYEAKYQEMYASFNTDKPVTNLGQLRSAAEKARQDLTQMRQVLIQTLRLMIQTR